MITNNKSPELIRSEASQISAEAKEELAKHLNRVKNTLAQEHHEALESEVTHLIKHHKETGESLKGPDGLAAKVKQRAEVADARIQYLTQLGNQKAILRFLKLKTAQDKLAERLAKNAHETAVAMAAKRVQDLLK